AKGVPPAKPLPAVPDVAAAAGKAGPLAALVSEGRRLFAEPAGPGTRRSCASCHRKGGTDLNALPLFGAAAAYPAAVDGKVMILDDRIAACFSQHLGATPPASGSPELRALDAYVTSLSQGRRMEMSERGGGPRRLVPMHEGEPFWVAKDAAKGKGLYATMCASCHGADGSGGAGPAVWGKGAFSATSAMGHAPKLASYISSAMAGYVGSMTEEKARDVAAFLETQPRPGRE
ncbi:MAG: c-type cytochrome, partial [Anaeromyxobacteraceae bacterium]